MSQPREIDPKKLREIAGKITNQDIALSVAARFAREYQPTKLTVHYSELVNKGWVSCDFLNGLLTGLSNSVDISDQEKAITAAQMLHIHAGQVGRPDCDDLSNHAGLVVGLAKYDAEQFLAGQ